MYRPWDVWLYRPQLPSIGLRVGNDIVFPSKSVNVTLEFAWTPTCPWRSMLIELYVSVCFYALRQLCSVRFFWTFSSHWLRRLFSHDLTRAMRHLLGSPSNSPTVFSQLSMPLPEQSLVYIVETTSVRPSLIFIGFEWLRELTSNWPLQSLCF